jgi:AAA domain/UvrD-like helicase C-terminal domain
MDPPIVKDPGDPFSEKETTELGSFLRGLDAEDRLAFRNANSDAIAEHEAPRMLVVSGPGTGKSFMFRRRLKAWLHRYPDLSIEVATFVRKLVVDLRAEIARDADITPPDKARVSVNTLHRLARSIVERNRGTRGFPLAPYCLMAAGEPNEEMLWRDALCFHPDADEPRYPWSEMRESLYDGEPRTEARWDEIRGTHLRIQQFYNALTFPDLILIAAQAVIEDPTLVSDTAFIIDEFQDFNLAEDRLIRILTRESPALLLVGDDDQVLYETLRNSHASIIREYYEDRTFANAVLPYCTRCGFHICCAASAFLHAGHHVESITKVFLPFHEVHDAEFVKIVATTSPTVGVEYIKDFVREHADAIRTRQEAIEAGGEKDAYLLILTPAKNLGFMKAGGARELLHELLGEFSTPAQRRGSDYWTVRDYYASALDPKQNYRMRKVLELEGVGQDTVCQLLRQALGRNVPLVSLDSNAISICLERSAQVKEIVSDGDLGPDEQVIQLGGILPLQEPERLRKDLELSPMVAQGDDDEGPSLEQSGGGAAVDFVSIVGSKGLSADHVIVLGCDSVNLGHVTRSAFFVAMTRARKSLTLMACMGGGGAAVLHAFVTELPDANTTALHVKATEVVEYETIAALQDHLETIQRAKAKSRQTKK